MKIYSKTSRFNADLYTPIDLFLRIRNSSRKPCLLECSDYRNSSESKSIIAFDPLAELILKDGKLVVSDDVKQSVYPLTELKSTKVQIQEILDSFEFELTDNNGFIGRLSFELTNSDETKLNVFNSFHDLPLVHLFVYKTIIVIDHFTNEGLIISNSLNQNFEVLQLNDLLAKNRSEVLPFETTGEEMQLFPEAEFKKMVLKAKQSCYDGEVFQLVVSNRFEQCFFGDDFAVYRELRRINPSPYLFYFDFEAYRIFGSSPEAQVRIDKGYAELHPIAGTVPRTGKTAIDSKMIEQLKQDEKENAEHTMLVDLARNDLSRDCSDVKVVNYKEVQQFSHVIHLVSKVRGKLDHTNSFITVCNSFPAGTLSGTPKPRALELINEFEAVSRDFYGGCVGILGANGNVNMAIVIRSFMSKDNSLYYRAGAGVVLDSTEDGEYLEVQHKIRPLRAAITAAVEVKYKSTAL